MIAPEFEFLPDGTVRFIIALTFAVFPVIVALARVYDLSGRGLVVTGPRDGDAQLTAILFSELAGYTGCCGARLNWAEFPYNVSVLGAFQQGV